MSACSASSRRPSTSAVAASRKTAVRVAARSAWVSAASAPGASRTRRRRSPRKRQPQGQSGSSATAASTAAAAARLRPRPNRAWPSSAWASQAPGRSAASGSSTARAASRSPCRRSADPRTSRASTWSGSACSAARLNAAARVGSEVRAPAASRARLDAEGCCSGRSSCTVPMRARTRPQARPGPPQIERAISKDRVFGAARRKGKRRVRTLQRPAAACDARPKEKRRPEGRRDPVHV